MSWGLRTCLSHSQGHGQLVPHGARVPPVEPGFPPCRGARFTPGLFHVQFEGSHKLLPAVLSGQLSCMTITLPQGLSPAPSDTPPPAGPLGLPGGRGMV